MTTHLPLWKSRYAGMPRSNRDGTCLWCGRALPPYFAPQIHGYQQGDLLGAYADGYFCGLRCGRDFGLAAALNGYRLAKCWNCRDYAATKRRI